MTKNKVRFTVSLAINDDKFDAFESIARTMVERTQVEPGALAYEFCLSDDRNRCRLIEEYVDADAVLAHMTGQVVQEFVPKMLEVSKLTGFEVYGNPGAKAGAMLKGMGAEIFEPGPGFSR